MKPGMKVVYTKFHVDRIERIDATVERETASGHYVIRKRDGRQVTVAPYSLRLASATAPGKQP